MNVSITRIAECAGVVLACGGIILSVLAAFAFYAPMLMAGIYAVYCGVIMAVGAANVASRPRMATCVLVFASFSLLSALQLSQLFLPWTILSCWATLVAIRKWQGVAGDQRRYPTIPVVIDPEEQRDILESKRIEHAMAHRDKDRPSLDNLFRF